MKPFSKHQTHGLVTLLTLAGLCFGQVFRGELRLSVTDPSGLDAAALVEIVSQESQTRYALPTDNRGNLIFRALPFGTYLVLVKREGFTTASSLVRIVSEIPREHRVSLSLGPVNTSVEVGATLLDPNSPGSRNPIGAGELERRPISLPGRTLIDVVAQQPGYVVEGNGIINPRGVDNGNQYVVDGFPITDIRSPAFAPELNTNDFGSVNVLTSGFPAEYGRRMGGVIEVNSRRDAESGWHGKLIGEGGSFSAAGGFAALSYAREASFFSLTGRYSATDRFFDPPVEQNYTNHGAESGETAQFEHDFTSRDRVRLSWSRSQSRFLVPNELIQEAAGQRQDRVGGETMGQVSYQRVISPHVLADVRLMTRDLSAILWSNPVSTPMIASQDRGFRETYLKGSVTANYGHHELKAGADGVLAPIHENFAYKITNDDYFEDALPRTFRFQDSRHQTEQAFFIQDRYRWKDLSLNLGIRYDHYQLISEESAWSPRVALSYFWRPAGLLFRGSYDRIYQPPPLENLLLSSSAAAQHLSEDTSGTPVPGARGNYWEGGFSRALLGKLRLDAVYFRRNIRNWSDDAFFLNTGVTFPTANYRAEFRGEEAKILVPKVGPFSGSISYTNEIGYADFPLTGGLILDVDDAPELMGHSRFEPSTVQRNTVNGLVRAQITRRYWVAMRACYNSGLPFEAEDIGNLDYLVEQYGPKVKAQLDLQRAHLRPNYWFDLSGGAEWPIGDRARARVQGEIQNIGDRFNVRNLAGMFSGTALGPPRSLGLRVGFDF